MGKGGGKGGGFPPLRVYPYLITYEPLFTVSPPPGTSKKTVARPCVPPTLFARWKLYSADAIYYPCSLSPYFRDRGMEMAPPPPPPAAAAAAADRRPPSVLLVLALALVSVFFQSPYQVDGAAAGGRRRGPKICEGNTLEAHNWRSPH